MLCYDECGNRENPTILMLHAENPHCKPMVLKRQTMISPWAKEIIKLFI